MAAKTPKRLVIPILLFCVALLLSGCAEKVQTVLETPERSEFTTVDNGASESDIDNKGDEIKKDILPVVTVPESSETIALSTAETGSENDDQAGKIEETVVADATKTEKNASNEKPAGGSTATTGASLNETVTETVQSGSGKSENPKAAAVKDSEAPVEIKFAEMYGKSSSRGLQFSEKMKSLDGKKVFMTGYMAPPLKPSLTFFVLTRMPMAICPFCDSDASWPEDIVLIYMPKGQSGTPSDSVLRVTGTLELGSHTDPDTGFVSQARIYSDTVETMR